MVVLFGEHSSRRRNQDRPVRVIDIQWDIQRRTLTLGHVTVALTSTEYRLLFPLRHGVPVSYADLASIAYNCAVDDKVRTMMDKHIDRIRGKLRGTGIYVYCVLSYGYLLFSETLSVEPFHDFPSRTRKIS